MAQKKPTATTTAATGRVPTEFIWQVYADATLAGAAKLIPIPLVDLVVEEYFRRRMPRDIAAYNGRILSQRTLLELNRRPRSNPLLGCLLLPFHAVIYLFKDIFRTVIYVMTVADASERLGHYWHRAFLLNYAMSRGDLDTAERTKLAQVAIERAMAEATTSPLQQLAQQVVITWKSQLVRLRTYVRYARNKTETERLARAHNTMATAWGNYREYWLTVAAKYDNAYASAELYQQVKVDSAGPLPEETP